ncbi:hypothetical protein RCK87_25915, partial [Salmonella enterica subsp. enterica serovar 1,4,[5],12:i:-]
PPDRLTVAPPGTAAAPRARGGHVPPRLVSVGSLIPRDRYDTVRRLALESDAVLGGFLRGQMLVMLILGVLYAVGLQLVGLNLGILIGL